MRWLVAAFVPAIPLLAGLLLSGNAAGANAANTSQAFLGSIALLLVAVGIFAFMATKITPLCRYTGSVGLALLFTVLAVPFSFFMVFVLMGVAVSLPDEVGKSPAAFLLIPLAQVILTAPLVLGAFIGIAIGNSKQLGQPLY